MDLVLIRDRCQIVHEEVHLALEDTIRDQVKQQLPLEVSFASDLVFKAVELNERIDEQVDLP